MFKGWVFLLLLCLVAWHVEGRGGGHGGRGGFGSGGRQPWWQTVLEIIGYAILGFVGVGIFGCICSFCCKACFGCDPFEDDDEEAGVKRGRSDVEQGNQRSYLYEGANRRESSVEEGPASTGISSTASPELEPLLPGERVTVQMVDEQLNKMDLPPAELTVTNLTKLLEDLSSYSGLPDVQGVLIKSKHSGYVEMTDLRQIPRGNLRVRAVIKGNGHMLRLHPEPQVPE